MMPGFRGIIFIRLIGTLLVGLSLCVPGWGFTASSLASPPFPEGYPAPLPLGVAGNSSGTGRILAPFYVLREHGSTVWWERILVLFPEARQGLAPATEELPKLRAAIHEALQIAGDNAAQEEKVRQAVQKLLGPEAAKLLRLDRCYLLVP